MSDVTIGVSEYVKKEESTSPKCHETPEFHLGVGPREFAEQCQMKINL